MRSLIRTLTATLLMLGGLGVGVAGAEAPTSGPATGPTSRRIPTVSMKSLVQLRLHDGVLELYTSHPATDGQITVRLDDPPANAQLKISSTSKDPPPYRPDAFDLSIEQVGGEGMIHTTVSSVAGSVQLWRDTTRPDNEVSIVQLVQSGAADVEGGVIRLYIQKMVGETPTGKSNLPATDFTTLIREHPEATDEYLRPLFDTLGGQEQLFDVEPALAAEVFASHVQVGADLQKTVAALIPQLDADRPQDRDAAQERLESLGQDAVVILRALDTSKLSLEQQMRIHTILAPQAHAAGVDPAKLRTNLHFLLDSLNNSEATIRRAALDELRQQTHQALVTDLDGPEDVRRQKVRELRRQLTAPPATTQAAK